MEGEFDQLTESLVSSAPALMPTLRAAHNLRIAHLKLIAETDYLVKYIAGLDECLQYVDALAKASKDEAEVSCARRLLIRAKGDFEAAVEAAISGYYSVVTEKMRDVLEIQLLFAEFTADSHSLEVWAVAAPDALRKQYTPANLRKREATRRGIVPKALPGTADYSAHSHFLHVGPDPFPIGGPGLFTGPRHIEVLYFEVCFWEMYYHASEYLFSAIALFGPHVDVTPELDYQDRLSQFREAWQISREREIQLGKSWVALGQVIRDMARSRSKANYMKAKHNPDNGSNTIQADADT